MDSLFSVLAAEDNATRTASRKAIIAANQRIIDTVGAFIQRSSSVEERDQRIALVGGDIEAIVASACADYGGDIEQITKSVRERLAKTCVCGGDPTKCQCGKKTTKEASTHESRKPRMCPYHKQVTDISLAQGEPKAGYEAMSQHSWSDKHCESDDYKGDKCKFKPEMTTQSYWTDRTDKAREKREERQQVEQEQQIQESPTEAIEESEPTEYTIDTTEWENEGGSGESDSGLDHEMQNAPSAITSEPEVTASFHTAGSYSAQQLTDGSGRWKVVGPGGTSQGVYDTQQEAQAEVNMLNRGLNNQNQSSKQAAPMMGPAPTPPMISGDPAARLNQQGLANGLVQPLDQQALADGHVQMPDSTTAPTPAMQTAQQMMGQQPGVGSMMQGAPGAAQIPPHPNNPGQQQQGVLNQIAPAGGQQAPGGAIPSQPNPLMPVSPYENLGIQKGNPAGFGNPMQASIKEAERGNDNLGGPSPKMDKRKWTPENLKQRVDSEAPDSRWPTHEIDIQGPITDERSDDFLDQTRAVTETQDVTKAWINDGSGKTKTFDGAGQATPVTSSEHWSASMTRQHFNLIADALKNAPGAGSELANHFADRLGDTNANFNRQRFIDAATPEESEKESSANPLYDLVPSQVTSAISQYREE